MMLSDSTIYQLGWKFLKELLSTLTHASSLQSTLESIYTVLHYMQQKFPSEMREQEKLLMKAAGTIFGCVSSKIGKPPTFAFHDKKV